MKKCYIIYSQGDKLKKAVLDESMLKVYRKKKDVKNIQEFETETLMETAYAGQVNINTNKKILLG